MRIISDFKDYYDFGMSYGVDPNLIYVRKEREESIVELQTHIKNRAFQVSYIGFAGKVYSAFHADYYTYSDKDPSLTEGIYYDFKDIPESYWDLKEDHYNKRKLYLDIKREKNNLKEYLEAKNKSEFKRLFKIYDTAIFVISCLSNWYFYINPKLRDYDFQKVLNPTEAFQELEMYVSSELNEPKLKEPFISDKIKAEIKGFDKHSFRKEKAIKV